MRATAVSLLILALTRLNIVTTTQIARNRRYAYLAIAVLAAALPGIDPISMLLEMIPLLVLFELSVALSRLFDRRRAVSDLAEGST